MKYCIDCKWFYANNAAMLSEKCCAPVCGLTVKRLPDDPKDIVTAGRGRMEFRTCLAHRSDKTADGCGIEAKHWAEIPF